MDTSDVSLLYNAANTWDLDSPLVLTIGIPFRAEMDGIDSRRPIGAEADASAASIA